MMRSMVFNVAFERMLGYISDTSSSSSSSVTEYISALLAEERDMMDDTRSFGLLWDGMDSSIHSSTSSLRDVLTLSLWESASDGFLNALVLPIS